MLTLIVANNILTEAALSFLGVGVPVLTPSWGNIIEQGYSSIVTAPRADGGARASRSC